MAASQKRPVQGNALVYGRTKLGRADTLPGPCGLHIRVMGRAITAHHDRQAGHPFPTDNANLYAALAGPIGDDRCKATVDEVYRIDALVPGLQLGAEGKVNWHKMWA